MKPSRELGIWATHMGTATLLLEIAGLRILTDPVLGQCGQSYDFGMGTQSTHTCTPHLPAEGLGSIDAVLLSHHQHGDNLDEAGTMFLRSTDSLSLITTNRAARALGKTMKGTDSEAFGLRAFESHTLITPSGVQIKVTATPARHGPPLSRCVVGDVVGFVLEWGEPKTCVYISGDTVAYRGLRDIGQRFKIDLAFLHLGAASFRITGPLRFTMGISGALRATTMLAPGRVVPIHYGDWTHLNTPPEDLGRALKGCPQTEDVDFRILKPGSRTAI